MSYPLSVSLTSSGCVYLGALPLKGAGPENAPKRPNPQPEANLSGTLKKPLIIRDRG